MKYLECGIGNRWLLRTEVEHKDGTEVEYRGWQGPIVCQSFYIRVWVGRAVYIIDLREGFKKQSKKQRRFKCVVGIVSQ
ncbi:DUF3977 family protein [Alkalihalobacillus sp. LMS6]|uniref:DUF3977 family protein n=1 Tax=Alkalihalobacillus sp. LMS6 TaxID=2924034 RepID=UPI0020D012F9|nr:DUF3977 family protein [Alkalihalobacillus sp. LMS6]UTR07061.1 DUF3977 family protein [Alkalihalobacillus sp. LMS6]